MPLDLRALVNSTIDKEEKGLTQKLNEAKRKQIAAERKVAEQMLFREYVEIAVETDPNMVRHRGAWDLLRQADILQDGLNILCDKENADPSSQSVMSGASMLGLSPTDVLPSDEAIKEFHNEVLPKVAMRIECDRDSLVKFVDPLGDRQRSGSLTSATPLSDAIEGQLSRLSLEKKAVLEKEEEKEELSLKLVKKYDDLLNRSLLTLQESFPIIAKHQATEMSNHLVQLKTLDLKAHVTHLKLMKKIYTPKRLKALVAIRHDIDKRKAEVDKECAKLSSALQSYDSVEPEFAEVVDEFKAVVKEIETHTFILNEYGIERRDEL